MRIHFHEVTATRPGFTHIPALWIAGVEDQGVLLSKNAVIVDVAQGPVIHSRMYEIVQLAGSIIAVVRIIAYIRVQETD